MRIETGGVDVGGANPEKPEALIAEPRLPTDELGPKIESLIEKFTVVIDQTPEFQKALSSEYTNTFLPKIGSFRKSPIIFSKRGFNFAFRFEVLEEEDGRRDILEITKNLYGSIRTEDVLKVKLNLKRRNVPDYENLVQGEDNEYYAGEKTFYDEASIKVVTDHRLAEEVKEINTQTALEKAGKLLKDFSPFTPLQLPKPQEEIDETSRNFLYRLRG